MAAVRNGGTQHARMGADAESPADIISQPDAVEHGAPAASHDAHALLPVPGTTTPAAHDFSRIPVHAPAPITIQPALAAPRLQRACACGGRCPRCQTTQPAREQRRAQTERDGSNESGRTAPPDRRGSAGTRRRLAAGRAARRHGAALRPRFRPRASAHAPARGGVRCRGRGPRLHGGPGRGVRRRRRTRRTRMPADG